METLEQKLQKKKNREMKEATDLLANLLAVEKLTVIDGGCTTSSIDLENRVVNIVRFDDDSPLTCKEVRITCIAHEIGHAIFTPKTLLHNNVFKEYTNIFPYINLVEDIRIENLIKGKYRGIHAIMQKGREIMFENAYYGEQSLKNINGLPIFDKILLYTKVGKNINGLKISEMDEAIVRYIKVHAKDEPSVVKCAKILYLYCKETGDIQDEKMVAPTNQKGDKSGNDNEPEENDGDTPDDSGNDSSEGNDGEDGKESEESESESLKERPDIGNIINRLSQMAEELNESDIEPQKTLSVEQQMERNIAATANKTIVSFAKKGEVAKMSSKFTFNLKI